MEHFEVKFEEQKIPEWYDFYFDYKYLKTLIASTKLKIKCKHITQSKFDSEGVATKLPGYYDLNYKDEI